MDIMGVSMRTGRSQVRAAGSAEMGTSKPVTMAPTTAVASTASMASPARVASTTTMPSPAAVASPAAAFRQRESISKA
jgi:hypothetical protein